MFKVKSLLNEYTTLGINMRTFRYISIFLVAITALLCWQRYQSPYQLLEGKIFGTYYKIKIKTNNINNKLQEKVKQTLKQVNHQMSVFDPNSEISQINQTAAAKSIKLSAEMSEIMRSSALIYRQSSGAFDPTVGKLVELWGFGTKEQKTVPDTAKIKEILAYTGFSKLKFADDFSSLQKSDARTYINLSAIAKGYGVDKIAELLENEGYHDFLVEIGGEIVARGSNRKGEGWVIGVAAPAASHSNNIMAVGLKDYAVATSGDYRNYFYENHHRYAHTISPKTGYPVEHNLASVTVFASNCMSADAYATAIMSLGEDKGMTFAKQHNLPIIMIIRDQAQQKFKLEYSPAARDLIGEGNGTD